MKPLHAQWLVNPYNYFADEKGKEVIAKGWERAEISGLLHGATELAPEDPFHAIYE